MLRLLITLILYAAPVLALAGSDACADPNYLRLRPPKYPSNAVHERVEGNVLVRAVVEIDGTPSHLEVQKSSGSGELDQAALDSVAEWRFNPALCDGKPKRKAVVVPVEFSLGDAADGQDDSGGSNPGSGHPFEIGLDPEPMEFSTADDGVRFLRSRPDIQEHRAQHASFFIRERDSRFWALVESYDVPAPNGPKRLIWRWRWLEQAEGMTLVIAVACGSDRTWCDKEMAREVAYLKGNPPPPPPPPPHD
jgi:TonB family protein